LFELCLIHKMVNCLVVGTGDMAHALAHVWKNNNIDNSNNLEVTKVGLKQSGTTFHDTGVPLVSLEDGLQRANIVVLAIPSGAVQSFVENHHSALTDKAVVDITNSSRGEGLGSVPNASNFQWVKAFNDIGAADLLLNKASCKTKIATNMCGPHADALNRVKSFAEVSFGMDVKQVPYENLKTMSESQNSLGDEWVMAAQVMLTVFAVTEVYSILRYNVFEGVAWLQLPMQVTNKAFCWTALTGFALTQVPGTLARLMNAMQSSNTFSKPKWLRSFLSFRKQLGLLSLYFLGLHVAMSVMLFNNTYYGKLFSADGTILSTMGAFALCCGIIATSFYVILGICSLPSVAQTMSNKSWQFVYGPVAWLGLAMGSAHVLIMGVPGWLTPAKWAGGMPPITMMSTILPLLVIFMKFVQIIVSSTSSGKRSSLERETPLVDGRV